LLPLISEVKSDSLSQRFEQLVKGLAGSKATRQLRNVCPVAAILDMDPGG
jgi:hypothetical protein